jgi:dTMP kinase
MTGAASGRSGLFIVLEGAEGSGKSTQLRLLADWLQAQRIPHVATREPGGTAVGEEIRQVLLHGHDMPPITELLLYNAARAAFVADIVKPALAAGKVVVADRFWLSSIAYQGYGRGLPVDEVQAICEFAAAGLKPDLTIILDVPVQTGHERRSARSAADRIERAGDDFHERVAEAYRLLPQTIADVEMVPGTGPADEVQERVRALLLARFPETFHPTPG